MWEYTGNVQQYRNCRTIASLFLFKVPLEMATSKTRLPAKYLKNACRGNPGLEEINHSQRIFRQIIYVPYTILLIDYWPYHRVLRSPKNFLSPAYEGVSVLGMQASLQNLRSSLGTFVMYWLDRRFSLAFRILLWPIGV